MTAEEYGWWLAEYSQRPWGEIRTDTGFGIVAATLANVNRSGNRPPYKATDFMPWHEKPDGASDADEDEREQILRMMERGGQ